MKIRKAEPLAYRPDGMPGGVTDEHSCLFTWSQCPEFIRFMPMLRVMQMAYMVHTYLELRWNDRKVRVLDVAAGFGEVGYILKSNRVGRGTRIDYVGIDADPRKKKKAEEYTRGRIEYRIADLRDPVQFRNAAGEDLYNAVVSSETLEHMEKESGKTFLNSCMESLHPGGYFILTSANPSYRRDNPWHLHEWEPDELRSHISQQGWKVEDWFYHQSKIRDISNLLPNSSWERRIPREVIRGAFSPFADAGSITVAVLRKD